MTRDEVVKGLECCVLQDPDDVRECEKCPQSENGRYISNSCINGLMAQSLALLKPVAPVYDDYGIVCGACGYMFEGAPNYCPSCGREINWNAGAREVRA